MEHVLGNLTEDQKVILKQFRKNLRDVLTPDHTDYALVKFLRAKNFNLKDSERIFRVNFNTRITFGINTILQTYQKQEVAKRYDGTGILGFAKNGTLVYYIASGRIDFYGFIMSMSCVDLSLYCSYKIESTIQILKEENEMTGKNIQEVTYILDLEGFAIQSILHKCVIEAIIDFVSHLQDNYPEIWSDVLIINAPRGFDTAFNFLKRFLRPNILERIRLADKSSSKDLLLKYIDENVLPAFLGGKRVDSNDDFMCREFVNFGGKIPEKLYSQHFRIPLMPTDPDVQCVTIRPRTRYNLCIPIHESGSKLRIQIRSENGSISITVFFKEFDLNSDNGGLPAEDEYLDETTEDFKYKQISLELRNQAHCTQEDTIIGVDFPGIYIFRLSNARNWFSSRKLLIKSEVFPPHGKSVS